MQSNEIRQKFLDFFEKKVEKKHKVMPSSSLISKDDPSVLFTTAGMQQFKKYYLDPELAEKELGSKNIVTVQKCVRTGDIDEVGDNTHLTFFEMLGNFSFGGYGRKEAIEYAHEFITKEMGLEISYVTVYEGSENVPKDSESENIWKNIDANLIIKEEGSDVFWGPTGNSGPCGPTTEIYCKNASGEDVEIWNIVFNEYFCNGSREQLDKGKANLEKLPVLGVDTGMGFERLVMTVQKKQSVYDTDLFNGEKTKEERIIVDHMRASEKLIEDGVLPANTGAGYVLRRLIRRMVRMSGEKELKTNNPEILKEAEKFKLTLEHGLKEFEKGIDPFILATTYGFPIELTQELAKEKGIEIDLKDFHKKMVEHQKLSRTASAGMFKGGLADAGDETKRLHTATHLLNQALRIVLGNSIIQKGSNITAERLRFDFTYNVKMTDEQKKKVEEIVNEKIKENLPVNKVIMKKEEAEKTGAEHAFGDKYGDEVSIYYIGNSLENSFSKEFCGGPHVANTGELALSEAGKSIFKIKKEEASSAGVRRIKAVLE